MTVYLALSLSYMYKRTRRYLQPRATLSARRARTVPDNNLREYIRVYIYENPTDTAPRDAARDLDPTRR